MISVQDHALLRIGVPTGPKLNNPVRSAATVGDVCHTREHGPQRGRTATGKSNLLLEHSQIFFTKNGRNPQIFFTKNGRNPQIYGKWRQHDANEKAIIAMVSLAETWEDCSLTAANGWLHYRSRHRACALLI